MPTDISRLDAFIDQAIDENQIVGGAVVVLHHGETVYERSAGFANREANVAVDAETIFRLDSLTKALVSVAAMRFVETKQLHPDDLVNALLPEYQPRLESGEPAAMRVRHLMTHTSGLGYRAEEGTPGPYTRAGVSDGSDNSGITMEENLRRLSMVPLSFEPSAEWRYSMATNLLGEIVGRLHGSSLREAIADLIAIPLGLGSISFDVTLDRAARLSAQYTDGAPIPDRMPEQVVATPGEGGMARDMGRVFDPSAFAAGSGGLVGTVRDVATFLEAVRIADLRIIARSSVPSLFENQIGGLECDPGWGHSFGWSVLVDPSKEPTPQTVGTMSWAGGLGHRWFIDPANELTVVSLSNTSYAGAFGPYPDSIRDEAYRLVEVD